MSYVFPSDFPGLKSAPSNYYQKPFGNSDDHGFENQRLDNSAITVNHGTNCGEQQQGKNYSKHLYYQHTGP